MAIGVCLHVSSWLVPGGPDNPFTNPKSFVPSFGFSSLFFLLLGFFGSLCLFFASVVLFFGLQTPKCLSQAGKRQNLSPDLGQHLKESISYLCPLWLLLGNILLIVAYCGLVVEIQPLSRFFFSFGGGTSSTSPSSPSSRESSKQATGGAPQAGKDFQAG